jgi:hypothetical protein
MELKSRRVEIGEIASSANGLWMSQIGRNLTDAVDGFFAGKRYLIHDRDPLYTKDFLAILAGFGIESVKLPPRSPNLNACLEFLPPNKKSCCSGKCAILPRSMSRSANWEIRRRVRLRAKFPQSLRRLDATFLAAG